MIDRTRPSFVGDIDRTRELYRAQGYDKAYEWAYFEEVPFARLSKPLAECQLSLVTTASPPRAQPPSPHGLPLPKEVASAPTDPPPERLYTGDLAWDKESTHTDDVNSFLPLRPVRELARAGRIGRLAARYHCVPTEYSQRRTREQDAPASAERTATRTSYPRGAARSLARPPPSSRLLRVARVAVHRERVAPEEDAVKSEVKSFMTGEPAFVEPDAPALAALDLMIERGIRHLPVVDRSRRVCGVLSLDDLRAAFPLPSSLRAPLGVDERRGLRELAVGEVMTYAPVTVTYDAPLEEAAQKMAEGRLGCLPVVDEKGHLDGILSETDLLHALVTFLGLQHREDERPSETSLAEALESERAHLASQIADYERREQALTESRRETPFDLAEESSTLEEGRLTERLADLAARRLRAIEHALDRERRGELGRCEGCGGRIPDARLRALPGATLCVRCARATEIGR